MTSKRIAELRRLAEAAAKCEGPYEGEWTIERDRACRAALRAYRTAASDALPELLDELEALQWEVVRVAPFLAVHGFEGYAVGADGRATKEETG